MQYVFIKSKKHVNFYGKVAPENIRSIFINKRIPEKYSKKGSSNPVLYCD